VFVSNKNLSNASNTMAFAPNNPSILRPQEWVEPTAHAKQLLGCFGSGKTELIPSQKQILTQFSCMLTSHGLQQKRKLPMS